MKGYLQRTTEDLLSLINCEDNGFIENAIKDRDGYFISKPTPDVKDKYWGVKKVIYTKINLLEIDVGNVDEKIFGEFDTLKDI